MTVIIEKILSSLYNLSNGFFLTIVLLAFVINIFVELINSRIKPLLKRTLDYNSFVKKKEIEIKEKINIKSLVNKEIFRLHKKYNYHPLYDFVAVVPFLVQLPFLLGVYFAIKNFKPFIGLTFLNIENISNPDNLIEGINLLPFLMTIVSVLLTIVHRNRFKLKDFVLPFLFFILLYNSPSSLIIYWTISMLIAFLLNLFLKTKIWQIISSQKKIIKKLNIKNYLLTAISAPFILELLFSGLHFHLLIMFVMFMLLIDNALSKYYNAFIIAISVVFFYSYLFYVDTHHVIHDLRFRNFALIMFIISFAGIYFSFKKNLNYILAFIITFSTSIIISQKNIETDINTKIEIKTIAHNSIKKVIKSSQPVILIILDGLSSSDEIFKFTNNKESYGFDKSLKSMDYKVYSSFTSKSYITQSSMSSLFNFNQHNFQYLIDYENSINTPDWGYKSKIIVDLFRKNLLTDSLIKKNVTVNSYGLIDFDRSISSKFDDYYWDNRFNKSLKNSSLKKLVPNISDKTIIGFIKKKVNFNNSIDDFRKKVLDSLKSFNLEKNNFYYFHLHAPHDPFTYFDEYPKEGSISLSKTEEYIKFKKFFLKKLLHILKNEKFNDSRIIITGDHGWRQDNRINKYQTSLYLKNYPNFELEDEFFVQDLGFLINNSFK